MKHEYGPWRPLGFHGPIEIWADLRCWALAIAFDARPCFWWHDHAPDVGIMVGPVTVLLNLPWPRSDRGRTPAPRKDTP